MTQGSYKQFCPVAMAAEILCTRWTVVLLRELIAGSTRFNDLRRGVPRMSPALLSQRLKELEGAGVIRRTASPTEPGVFEYHLTTAGRELEPLVQAFGVWGQRWVESELSLQHLDAPLLMWDMRRNLDRTRCRSGAASSSSNIRNCRRGNGHGGCWWSPTAASICARSIRASMSIFMSRPICAR
jgi:DNA-binding HxlR family transcriptional regulator